MLIILNKKENEQFISQICQQQQQQQNSSTFQVTIPVPTTIQDQRRQNQKILAHRVHLISFFLFLREIDPPLFVETFIARDFENSWRGNAFDATPSRGEFLGWSICKIAGDRDNSRYSTFLSRKINSKLPFNRWR